MTLPGHDGGRPVVAADLLRVRWPLEPALRGDRRAVAYTVSGLDAESDALTYDVHLVTLDGAGRSVGASRRIDGCRAPRWAPTGTLLACAATVGEPGLVAVDPVAVTDSTDAAARRIFAGRVVDFDWSPDGTRVAVLSPPAGLALIDVASGERQTWAVPSDARLVRWSPHRDTVAVVAGTDGLDGHPLVSTVTLVDPATGAASELLTWNGPVLNARWSPDGSVLAIVGHDRGAAGWEPEGVWLLARDGGAPTELTAGHDIWFGRVVRGDDERAFGAAPLAWSPDGSSVLTTIVDGGSSRVVSVDHDGRLTDVVAGERAVLEFAVAGAGPVPAFAFTWSDPSQPGELSLLDGGVDRQLTELNTAWRSEVELAPTVALRASDPDDPAAPTVEGWLTVPPSTSAPLVVQVHGGPHHPVGLRFSFDTQRLAALGFAVLRSNPRGSTGRGREFARAVQANWGGPDLRDVLALTGAAGAYDGVDGDRAAIVGESYGGFLVYWTVVTTGRYLAAIAENGISDPFTLAVGPRGPNFWWLEFGVEPRDDPGAYRSRSAAALADRVTTPLLLLHAEDDDNVPIGQSELMHRALTERGKPVRFVTVPGEGHMVNVFGRPSHRLRRTRRVRRVLCSSISSPTVLSQESSHEDQPLRVLHGEPCARSAHRSLDRLQRESCVCVGQVDRRRRHRRVGRDLRLARHAGHRRRPCAPGCSPSRVRCAPCCGSFASPVVGWWAAAWRAARSPSHSRTCMGPPPRRVGGEAYGGPVRADVRAYAASGGYIEGVHPRDTWPDELAGRWSRVHCDQVPDRRLSHRRGGGDARRGPQPDARRIRLMADGNAAYMFRKRCGWGGPRPTSGSRWYEEPMEQRGGTSAIPSSTAALDIGLAGGEGLVSRHRRRPLPRRNGGRHRAARSR